jgi:hypothetical protein
MHIGLKNRPASCYSGEQGRPSPRQTKSHAQAVQQFGFGAIGFQGGYMIGLTGRDLFGQFISRFRTAPSRST